MSPSAIRLSARLDGLRRLVEPGARVIDVGADHGLLAIALAFEGRVERILATECEEHRAVALRRHVSEHLAAHGPGERLEIRIGDGLEVLRPEDAIDTAIFAGMGPHTIAAAIAMRPAAVPLPDRLVLQPQRDAARARHDLLRLGFRIEREVWVVSGGRGYPLIAGTWCGTGAPDDANRETHPTLDFESLLHVGPRLVERPSAPLLLHWREEERRAARDLEGAGNRPEAAEPRRRRDRARAIVAALEAALPPGDRLV